MKITPFNGSNIFNGSKPFLGGTGRTLRVPTGQVGYCRTGNNTPVTINK